MMIVSVAVDLGNTAKEFLDYQVPADVESQIAIGIRVEIPLGRSNRPVAGYVVAIVPQEEGISYKAVLAVLEETPLLDEHLVQLALWVSQRYCAPAYYVLEYLLPKFARQKKETLYRWQGGWEAYQSRCIFFDENTDTIAKALLKGAKTDSQLQKLIKGNYHQAIANLTAQGIITSERYFKKQGGCKKNYSYESLLSPADLAKAEQTLGRAKKQFELLRYLTYEGAKSGEQLRGYWSNYLTLLKELQKKGFVAQKVIEPSRVQETAAVFQNRQTILLNDEQQAAVKVIDDLLTAGKYQGVLIHGVTGSGKTEIYLRAIKKALALGRGAIFLVPEIVLTPQLIGRFQGVLGEQVAVLHSNLSDGERYDVWQKLRKGLVKVVVGVRSAVFAPVQDLGLLILDEEHETTFKQSEPQPRYHAREVALKRAELLGAVVLLGSATPSVESYYRVSTGEYGLLELKERAQKQPMPQVELVDMAAEFKAGNRSIFSRALADAMEEALKKGEQVILYLNRRGFASAVLCRECGHTMMCPKCNIALTYHKAQNALKCHYCDYITQSPQNCPNCGSKFIRYFGSGTQLVEEEVLKKWSWLKTLRMDRDTTQNKNAHQKILEAFAKKEAQVLIGTQMITKGLDFPNVTVVGVIAADITLNMPDYTASEHNFQLLTQVAGRAGRGDKRGIVFVQTYNPNHYSLLCAKNHDYRHFYQQEIKNRQLLSYPPFSAMVRFLVSDVDEEAAKEQIEQLKDYFAQNFPDIEILGPAIAPIEKIRGRYRYHLLLKDSSLSCLLQAANHGQNYVNVSRKSKSSRIIIDVEPQSIL